MRTGYHFWNSVLGVWEVNWWGFGLDVMWGNERVRGVIERITRGYERVRGIIDRITR